MIYSSRGLAIDFEFGRKIDEKFVLLEDYYALQSKLGAANKSLTVLRKIAKEWMADDTLGANYEAINRMCEILFPDEATP